MPPKDHDLKYLDMSLEDLELSVGAVLLGEKTFGSKPATDTEKRSIAREWFEHNLPMFRTRLCGDEAFCGKVFGPEQQERNVLLGTIIDTLAAAGGWTVPVAALGAMLIHYGLDRLCGNSNLPAK